jgi:hypothetical protein
MIPLTVCGTGSSQAWLAAGLIVLLAIGVGSFAAWQTRLQFRYAVLVVASLLVPVAMVEGWWPFDPSWRYDCGATPDPNIEVYFATLAYPVIAIVTFLLIRRKANGR